MNAADLLDTPHEGGTFPLDPQPTRGEVLRAVSHAVMNSIRLPTCADVEARRAAIAAIIKERRRGDGGGI